MLTLIPTITLPLMTLASTDVTLARRGGGGIFRLVATFFRALTSGQPWAMGVAALAGVGIVGWLVSVARKA